MKILRVISSMDPKTGGPCQGIRNSIPAQKNRGIESEVLSFDAANSGFLKKDNLKIYAIGPAKGPYSYCSGLTTWLNDNLLSFDVVIIHGLWLHNSYGTYRIWKKFKNKNKKVPKLYVMPHGMLDPYFQKGKGRRLKAIRNWLFWMLIERRVINGADGLLFTCEQELLLARETFQLYHPKTEVNVGYGIKLPPTFENKLIQEFYKKCTGVINRPYWLFLSRIHPKKGVDLLIKAYLRLQKENKDIPDLVIAGPGLKSFYGEGLQKIAKGRSIHFPGMLEEGAKWGAFHACKAFILPSHQENFGISVVEAMACAKPVLISNKINICREIEKANAGLVYENTEEGVYSMLKYWINESYYKQNEMGMNALGAYKRHFAIEKAAMKMVDCLK